MSTFIDGPPVRPGTRASFDQETGAANTAVAITIVAESGKRHYLPLLAWSYDGAPTGGRLTVTGLQNSETLDLDLDASGMQYLPLPPLCGAENTNVVITLAAGGTGVVGKLNVWYASFKQNWSG